MADTPQPLRSLAMPDVVSESAPALSGALDWVGMAGIALPLRIRHSQGETVAVLARASAWVSLSSTEQRGIHMSRLYSSLDRLLAERHPSRALLQQVLSEFLGSHKAISDRARLRLCFDLPVRRNALRSALGGWRAYPVEIIAELDASGLRQELEVRVEYSSTCPGSAALSRQLVQHQFGQDFSADAIEASAVHAWLGSARGVCATPHAQRSVATIRIRCTSDTGPDALALIDLVETALGTPVQTAVKREDEQEFARLNGANPMYCEDAARRIRRALEQSAGIDDYLIRAAHLESLHPHDAVAVAARGVPGGFSPVPD